MAAEYARSEDSRSALVDTKNMMPPATVILLISHQSCRS